MDVIDFALEDEADYADKSAPEFQAFRRLGERSHKEYDDIYGDG